MVLIHEHQSTLITNDKARTIGDYVMNKMISEKLPPLAVISTNTDAEKSQKEIRITPSLSINFKFVEIDEKNNRERLSRITNKFNTNQTLNTHDILELGIIALYVKKEYATERLKKVVDIYTKLEDMEPRLELVIYSVLYAIIDAHFDDEKEFKRMIEMIDLKTSPQTREEFSYRQLLEEENAALKISQQQSEKEKEEFDKYKIESEKKIAELERRVKELEGQKEKEKVKKRHGESEIAYAK